MAVKQEQQQRNYLFEYITIAQERCDKAREKYYAMVKMEYFEHLAIVTIQVGDRTQTACFLQEQGFWAPVFTYWLTREQRLPLVGRMYKQGISGTKIAQFLKLSAGTIYRDLATIRETAPNKIQNRSSLLRSDIRPGRLINEGDFKLAALNFEAQKLDMQAFLKSPKRHGAMTLQ
jgi:hypothetical protein